MFEVLTPHCRDNRPLVKVRVINKVNGKAIDIVDALWDTGSSHTCISKDIADQLELKLYGNGFASTANGDAAFSKTSCLIGMPDFNAHESNQVLVNLNIQLRKHVIIGQDIMQYGLTLVDTIKDKDGNRFTRLKFILNEERK